MDLGTTPSLKMMIDAIDFFIGTCIVLLTFQIISKIILKLKILYARIKYGK